MHALKNVQELANHFVRRCSNPYEIVDPAVGIKCLELDGFAIGLSWPINVCALEACDRALSTAFLESA